MELTSRFRVPAPVGEAYQAFAHLDRLAPCFPGASVTSARPDQVVGTLDVKLGSVLLRFLGTVTYLDRDPDRHRVALEARGDDSRGAGSMVATVQATLRPSGDGTDVEVVAEVELGGKPARYAPEVVIEEGEKLLASFAAALAGRFAEGGFGVAGDAEASSRLGGTTDVPAPTWPAEQPRHLPHRYDYRVPGSGGRLAGRVRRGTTAVALSRYGLALAGAGALTYLTLRVLRSRR